MADKSKLSGSTATHSLTVLPTTSGDPLSFRELQVIELTASGFTSAEMATLMHCAKSTVETYIIQARIKLDAKNRSHMVAVAFHRGILTPIGI